MSKLMDQPVVFHPLPYDYSRCLNGNTCEENMDCKRWLSRGYDRPEWGSPYLAFFNSDHTVCKNKIPLRPK